MEHIFYNIKEHEQTTKIFEHFQSRELRHCCQRFLMHNPVI